MVYWRWVTTWRSPDGSSRRAASSRVGAASGTTWSGRSRVLAASTSAWAAESSPAHKAAPVAGRGPRNRARAVRTAVVGGPLAIRSGGRAQRAGGGGALAQRQAGPQPAGGGAELAVLVGAGLAAGIDGGEFVEPLAFEA